MATPNTNTQAVSAHSTSNLIVKKIKQFSPIIFASIIGLLIITAVGFAGSDILHNAAHDIRHGLAFPCH